MKGFRERFPVISYKIGKVLQILRTYRYRKNPVKWTLRTYKKLFGVNLNLTNPQTFYEKINFWKHYSYNPAQDTLTDKLLVKDFLKAAGYGGMCAKCYFSANSIKELKKWYKSNASTYKKFVLKTSHSCGDVFIIDNNKITKKNGRKIKNISKVFKMLKTGLKFNHYYSCFEQNYKNLNPQVFAEEFIDYDKKTVEYEIFCNYGVPVFTNVVLNRQGNKTIKLFYDCNFNFIDTYEGEPSKEQIKAIKEPREYKQIKTLIKSICESFPFCRVDFVQTNSKTYFCEFTFSKSGGMELFRQEYLNIELGKKFKL